MAPFVVTPWIITDISSFRILFIIFSPPLTRSPHNPHSMAHWPALSFRLFHGLFRFAFFRCVFVESVWIRFSNVRRLQIVSVAKRPQNDDQTTEITHNYRPPYSRYKVVASSVRQPISLCRHIIIVLIKHRRGILLLSRWLRRALHNKLVTAVCSLCSMDLFY